MATDESKSYPKIPAKQWWALRSIFRRSIPAKVTPTYLAPKLGVNETSASTNIMPALRTTGIIDDDGKTLDRAKEWRDDKQYAKVCAEIIKEVYPQELRDLAPDTGTERSEVSTWMASKTGAGTKAVGKMSAFYMLLLEADPEKATAKKKPIVKKTPLAKPKDKVKPKDEKPADPPPADMVLPPIHLNIQVHISQDATTDQINQVFKSMAKHLKDFYKQG